MKCNTFTRLDPSIGVALNLKLIFNDLRICFGRIIDRYELGFISPVNAGWFISMVSSQFLPLLPKGHMQAYPVFVFVHLPPFSPQIPGKQSSPIL